ncbi:MAG: hypothetical protein CM1200mP18_00970 [Gammaproteobacteria bacterium]|nr:MAG: hypothetical protein CM1200mP18_00970 [Gammaproteobacteria bacterium]
MIERQAALVAQWQLIGFIHGVMNTDNMSIAAETIDYGPCAFMDTYHPETVYSSIDHMGRYAYQNQPPIAHWNLAGLAQALLPLLSENEDEAVEKATAAINAFPDHFKVSYTAGLGRKLGLSTVEAGDKGLGSDLLERMARNKADFTLTFRYLSALSQTYTDADNKVRALFEDPPEFDQWAVDWRGRLKQDGMPIINARIRCTNRTLSIFREIIWVEARFVPQKTTMTPPLITGDGIGIALSAATRC